jgi:hypothetical protein
MRLESIVEATQQLRHLAFRASGFEARKENGDGDLAA